MRGKEIYVPGTKQYDEGIKVGREEGFAEGRAESHAEVFAMLQRLISKGTITSEDAAEVSGISAEAFRKQAAELK